MPRERRGGIHALSHCGAVFLRLVWILMAGLFFQKIFFVPEREEIHYARYERRARQRLPVVSIYLGSIQMARGVSVSEISRKKIRPTRKSSGFFVLGDEN